jgi:homoserine O-acetyltransferase/O-succinyltransferase
MKRLVKPEYFTFARDEPFTFHCGKSISPVTIEYETYGTLNKERDNGVLILHALSGTAHAAGYNSEDDRYPGWWDHYIGPGKPFDTDKFFIISSNVLGGCNGTTGPLSENPETGEPYGLDFPFVTIKDMVHAQYHLVKHLGIDKLLAVAGGSMGGMQALKWSILYPHMMSSVIAIATSASISAQSIALNEVGRQAIIRDPHWNNGKYHKSDIPSSGLSLARMIGHITYLSEAHMHEKFGRRFQEDQGYELDFHREFQVESYLHYQGDKFVQRFDANTYLYITKAIDYFDLEMDYGSLVNAFEEVIANYLIVSFTTDWLYPSSMAKEIVKALRINGKNVHYTDIDTDKGHDAFLVENRPLEQTIGSFLTREHEKRQNEKIS